MNWVVHGSRGGVYRYIRGLNRLDRLSFAAFLNLSILSLTAIFPIANKINSAEATVTPSTTTLTLSTSDISAEITPNSTNGTFVASDPATISVVTNNYSGYTLGITSSDNVDNTKLINTDDNSIYLTSISSASIASEFTANTWGYLPSKLNSQANTSYQPAPTTTATTLEATNTANANANEYTIALGAKADYTLPAGTYENTFNIIAIANPVNYSITYNKNTTDTVTNMPANQSGDVGSSDITIANNTPTRTGYNFFGWCDVATNTTNGADSCSGTIYSPNNVINTDKTTSNNIILYAMWEQTPPAAGSFNRAFYNASKTKITVAGARYYKMQDMSATICNNITTGQYGQLVDTRDNTIYNVGKLADNRCWFLDNLALDIADPTVLNSLTPTNTNASNTALYYLKNGGGSTSNQYAIASVSSDWNSSYSYSAPLVNLANKDVIPDNAPTNSHGNNKVGGYYNYCAASAGTYCYGNGTDYGTSSGNTTEDICPAGWRLPTGGSANGEYRALTTAIIGAPSGSNYNDATKVTNFRTAFSASLPGSFSNGATNNQGNRLHLWTSTRYDDYSMYSLYIATPSDLYPYNVNGRRFGMSIRCIADRPATISDLNYVQDFADLSDEDLTSVKNSMTLNQAYQLTDNRDSTVYHIAKLADGNVWFLDNLALDLTDSTVQSTLNSGNTNASSTSLNYLINGGGTANDKYAITGVANWTSGRSYSAALVNMDSKNTVPANAPTNGQGNNKVGGYYNFCAISAGSYCYGDGTSAGISLGDATEDICPAGWRLPTSNTGEFGALANAIYGSTEPINDTTQIAKFRTILSLPHSGYFVDGSATDQGIYGRFRSSTRKNGYENYMHYMRVSNNVIDPSGNYDRAYGISVRCIANNSRNILNFTSMQDFASLSYGESKRLKASMDINTAYLRTDSRDNTSYHIAKLADGNVWMLDNLALDLTNSTVKSTLSSVNTNASDTSINYLKNGGGTTSDRYATAGVSASWTTNSNSAPLINMTNKDVVPSDAPANSAGYNKVGGYYNYCAATAGFYCYGNGTSYGTPSGNATEDICPAGWRLPTGDSNGEYQSLASRTIGGLPSNEDHYSDTASIAKFRTLLSTPSSGYYNGGAAARQGTYGGFWSSSNYNDSGVYYAFVSSSNLYTFWHNNRMDGFSVRCIHAY